MLTVKEINEVSFGKAGFSGYKPEDVDRFIDEVASSFQQLLAERDEAVKRSKELAAQVADLTAKYSDSQEKLGILAQKIETYREEEEGIKEAILSAQKLAKDSVQEAKDKAAVILQDARADATRIREDAKVDAARTAKEYMIQADEKKEELEEIKRQVSAFRSSLLEMYKKHLEAIDHIPSFRPKERVEAPVEAPAEPEPVPAEPEPVEEAPSPEPEPLPEPEPEPAPEPVDELVEEEPVETAEPVRPAASQPAKPRPAQPGRSGQPSLHDKVDFSREQTADEIEPSIYPEVDLAEVGIDLRTYSDIPESLRREKSTHFSNLEFGDGVDLGNKKRRK